MNKSTPGVFASPKILLEYALSLFIPLLLACFWFSINRGYPVYDAADYVQNILPAAQALKRGEFLSAMQIAYWQRGWKVIILPVLIGPFIAFTSDIRLAVALCNLAVYSVFLVYLVRLLRLFLSGVSSALLTWFIGTLPWVLISVFQFMCELPFMAAGMATLYYLFENEGFRSRRQSCLLGVSLAIVFCIQPFVAAVGIGLVYLFFILRAYRSGHIEIAHLLAAMGLSLIVLGVPGFLETWNSGRLTILVLVWTGFFAGVYYLLPNSYSSKNFFVTHGILLTSALFWFAPFYKPLISWAYDCTFGNAVDVKRTPVNVLSEFFNGTGGNLLALFALAALCLWILSFKFKVTLHHKVKDLFVVVALLLVPILVALFTRNGDPRYHFFGITALYILFVAFLAGETSVIGKAMRTVLLLAGLVHAYWVIDMMTGDDDNLQRNPIYRFNVSFLYERLIPITSNGSPVIGDAVMSLSGEVMDKSGRP